jgi:hypothetical protein
VVCLKEYPTDEQTTELWGKDEVETVTEAVGTKCQGRMANTTTEPDCIILLGLDCRSEFWAGIVVQNLSGRGRTHLPGSVGMLTTDVTMNSIKNR